MIQDMVLPGDIPDRAKIMLVNTVETSFLDSVGWPRLLQYSNVLRTHACYTFIYQTINIHIYNLYLKVGAKF